MNRWLLKTEPSTFGLDHLRKKPQQVAAWDGVRNFQARNFLRAMKKGDQAFFYHSSCEVPGIVALVDIVREAYPDPTAFDPRDDHHDDKSDPDAPRWFMVDVKLRRTLKRTITLQELKGMGARLAGFTLLRPGNRLSVMPVEQKHWDAVLKLE
jgi:predicted RNA-binding protein with PUA-like domain